MNLPHGRLGSRAARASGTWQGRPARVGPQPWLGCPTLLGLSRHGGGITLV
jgi:hypothetical protein